MSASQTKIIFTATFLLLFFLTSFGWAADISTLVSKRVSQDGKTLDLSGLNIGASGAKQLAKMDLLAGITALHLQGNNIRARGMKALAKSPHLAGLKHIDLWGNLLGDLGLKAISESPYLNQLETL